LDYPFLSKTTLFRGAEAHEIAAMLACLQPERRQYEKGQTILHAGQTVRAMGLVLSGSVSIEHDDVWGNKSILDHALPGQVFAETYACVPDEPLPIRVVAAERCTVLFLDMGRVLHPCANACDFHGTLIRNLLSISSQKNLRLSRRIFHTSAKTIRGRLLSYLSFQATQLGRQEFDIPFNRQQLADYLSVDRSALSAELGKMQQEGLLRFHRSHFLLLSPQKFDT